MAERRRQSYQSLGSGVCAQPAGRHRWSLKCAVIGTLSDPHGTCSVQEIMRRIVSRLILLFLLGLSAMPVATSPTGAVQPLWAVAADLRMLKSYAAAVEVYEQIATLSVQDPGPFLSIGEIYVAQHRWPLAEDAFNRAMARHRDGLSPSGVYAQALAGLATSRWEQGDRLRAIELWEAALASRPVEQPVVPGVRVRLALAYLDTDRFADAEAMLKQELADIENPVAHLYLAMMQAADDPHVARQELAAIIDDGPPAVVSARDYVQAALAQAETVGSAAGRAKSLGLAFVQVEEWQLARLALERALMLDPTDAEAMAFLGHTKAQSRRPAFADLTGAVAARPDWPLGHYLLGLLYLQHEAYEVAIEEFLVTLELDPGNARSQVELARAYLGLGEYLAAENALMKAVESAPKDLAFHKALAHFYADHTYRIADRGLPAAQSAVDLGHDDPQARDLLGWMCFLAGDPISARLHLESALQLEPELVSAHYHLGVLRRASGEREAARFAFLRTIDLDTDGFYRDQAQKVLREMNHAQD